MAPIGWAASWECWAAGWTFGPAYWVKDLALLQLQHRSLRWPVVRGRAGVPTGAGQPKGEKKKKKG